METAHTPKHLTILTGASRGMGFALAQQLLTPHSRLLCMARHSRDELTRQAEQCGAELLQWQADLAAPLEVAERLRDWLAMLDPNELASATLINNAGVIAPLTAVRDADLVAQAQALRVGLEAPMALCTAFLGATRHWTQVPRKVLNVSSGLGRRAMASSGSYCAAKAGMDHFTRCLALEEAQQANGARVCSLAPGVIDTGMQVQLRTADAAHFPDQHAFASLHEKGQLTSTADAAQRLLAFLNRPDFGAEPVADVRN